MLWLKGLSQELTCILSLVQIPLWYLSKQTLMKNSLGCVDSAKKPADLGLYYIMKFWEVMPTVCLLRMVSVINDLNHIYIRGVSL